MAANFTLDNMFVKQTSSGLPFSPFHSSGNRTYAPIITLLDRYPESLYPGALNQAVQNAYPLKDELVTFGILSGEAWLSYVNDLLMWVPHENQNGKDIYDTICHFYYVLDQKPLKSMQNAITPAEAKKPLNWLSAWLVAYAQLVRLFMDTPDSITNASFQTFVNSLSYRVSGAVISPGGLQYLQRVLCS